MVLLLLLRTRSHIRGTSQEGLGDGFRLEERDSSCWGKREEDETR